MGERFVCSLCCLGERGFFLGSRPLLLGAYDSFARNMFRFEKPA